MSTLDIHFEPIELIGRVYCQGGSYEERTPFDTVFNISLIPPATAFLRAAKGTLSMEIFKEIGKKLNQEYGITCFKMERYGRLIEVPLDKVLRE